MANSHNYGMRWVRSLTGAETPTTLRFPIADDYQATTVVGAGTNVNLNIGDPVKLGEDGTIKLVQAGQDVITANADHDDYIFGVIAGFESIVDSTGKTRPGNFLAGATSHGGIGSSTAPIALVIPVANNIFEIDADAVLGTATKAGALGMVGKTTVITYSVLTAGVGQPKANPLMDADTLANTVQGQLVIVGLGSKGDAMDFAATNVTFQVMASAVDLAAHPDAGIYGGQIT